MKRKFLQKLKFIKFRLGSRILDRDVTANVDWIIDLVDCSENEVFYIDANGHQMWKLLLYQERRIVLKKQVLQLSCAIDHVTVLTAKREVYSLGFNQFGQLGEKPCTKQSMRKVEFPVGFKVGRVTARYHQNFALANNEETMHLFSWGDNRYSKLGRGKDEIYLDVGEVNVEGISSFEEDCIVAIGMHHCLLSNNNELYAFGWGLYGQLGIGKQIASLPKPKRVKLPNSGLITSIAAGHWHSVVVLNERKVLGFGWNKFKQLLPTDEFQVVTSPVFLKEPVLNTDESITSCQCGSYLSLFTVSISRGYYRLALLGKYRKQYTPLEVMSSDDKVFLRNKTIITLKSS